MDECKHLHSFPCPRTISSQIWSRWPVPRLWLRRKSACQRVRPFHPASSVDMQLPTHVHCQPSVYSLPFLKNFLPFSYSWVGLFAPTHPNRYQPHSKEERDAVVSDCFPVNNHSHLSLYILELRQASQSILSFGPILVFMETQLTRTQT